MKWVMLWSFITIITLVVLYMATVAVCGTKLEYCTRGGGNTGGTNQGGDGQEAGND
jgi:hypothetical protein